MARDDGPATPSTRLPFPSKLPDIPKSFPDAVNKPVTNVPPLPPRRRDNLDTGPEPPRPKQYGEEHPTRSILTSDKD